MPQSGTGPGTSASTLPALRQAAGTLRVAEFCQRYPGTFLVAHSPPQQEVQFEFHTSVVSDVDPDETDDFAGIEVIPLVKRAGNPYPDRLSVGRARNCDIVVRHNSVSKLHAHFRHGLDGKLELIDLDSHNHTFVAGVALTPAQPVEVSPPARIRFGAVETELLDSARLHQFLTQLK